MHKPGRSFAMTPSGRSYCRCTLTGKVGTRIYGATPPRDKLMCFARPLLLIVKRNKGNWCETAGELFFEDK